MSTRSNLRDSISRDLAYIPLHLLDANPETHEHWVFATLSRHTVSHLSSMVNLQASGKSQTQENWGLFAHQPSVGLTYPTICSTNNTKHRTQICTLVLSLALSVSRRCGIGIGGHPGQQHRVYGTPDGGAMVMGADTSSPLA